MPGKYGFDFNGASQSFNVLAEYLFGKVDMVSMRGFENELIAVCCIICHALLSAYISHFSEYNEREYGDDHPCLYSEDSI